jgi:hypothetical protein
VLNKNLNLIQLKVKKVKLKLFDNRYIFFSIYKNCPYYLIVE